MVNPRRTHMEIEFTDRYGGNPPSWLRGCHGHCEAMGYYPVQTFDKHPPELKAQVERDVYGLYRNLTEQEAILVDSQIEKNGYSEDAIGAFIEKMTKPEGNPV